MPNKPFKIPQSVLVVIHTPALDVLVLRRTDGEELRWPFDAVKLRRFLVA